MLTKGFTFHTVDGESFSVDKGTEVVVRSGWIYFITNPELPIEEQPVRATLSQDVFYLYWYGEIRPLEPFFPKVPYPFTMITPPDFEMKIQSGAHREKVIEAAYHYFLLKSKRLKDEIKRIEDENTRRARREELADFARAAASFFKKYKIEWAYYEWLSKHYKWRAIVSKALGDYKDALNKLRKAEEAIENALSSPHPEKYYEELQKTKDYYRALRSEVEAQIALFSYKFSEAVEMYREAAELYERTGDVSSADWCKTLHNAFRALELLFRRELSEAYEYLRKVYQKAPAELKSDIESWRQRLVKGEMPTPDRILITLIVSLIGMYEEHIHRLVSYYGSLLGGAFEGYVATVLTASGYELWFDKRIISEGLTEEEKQLIEKYGSLEVDILGYHSDKKELIIGECKCKIKRKKVTKHEIEEFLEKAEAFIKRETWGRPKIRIRKIYISYYGFTKDCYNVKGVELIDGKELEEWARSLRIKPLRSYMQ